jgi:outer membrane receptor protein involved in Fe transport
LSRFAIGMMIVFASAGVSWPVSGYNATQATTGAIQGQVTDSSGAAISGAKVTLSNSSTHYQSATQTDDLGTFKFFNIPFNEYKVRVESDGFLPADQSVDIHSAVPVQLTFPLKVGTISEQVNVTAEDNQKVESDKTQADTALSTTFVNTLAGAAPSKALEKAVESAPGIVADDDGRYHSRGSESGVQTVINGIPISDNLSSVFSTSVDPRNASQIEVVTGGIPAEFGGNLAAVINLTTKSGLDIPISGEISGTLGSFQTGDAAASFGGHVKNFGWFSATSASTSHRYLDPPTIENFHNVGRSANNVTTLDYNPTPNDSLRLTLMFGGANFDVPNRLNQELAGQDQRQQQRSFSESLSWHHLFSQTLLGDISIFHRYATSKLNSNPLSTPVVAFQDRSLTNYGFIGSLSYASHGHTFKTGFQYTRTPVSERFSFYPTDPNSFPPLTTQTGATVPNPVLQFSAAKPFAFRDSRTGRKIGAFVQDRFSPFKNFTLDVGVRYDDYNLLIHKYEFSPRVAIAYFVPRTQTVLRASYNRYFQPPPAENLLLAGSIQAASISPLAVETGQVTVKQVLPDEEHVYEFGVQQQMTKFARLTVSIYNKQIRNFSDKDQFFDTGVIFPISIFAGRVTGEEVRIDTAQWRGLSGFVSYANSRSFGITPISGGLFLGEVVDPLRSPGFRFPNDHDERTESQFQVNYTNKRTGWWATLGGRYDSGVPAGVDPATTPAQFAAAGFDPRFFNDIDFQRGRIKPRMILNISTGVDLFQKEHVGLSAAFGIENLTDKFYLYNFESVFSGTHVGPPRLFSGHISLKFK